MKFQVTLLLVSVLFSHALSLTCQQCVPLGLTPCVNTPINCSSQCATATVSVSTGVSMQQVITTQTCSTPDMCINGSVNIGPVNFISNAKCCSTDYCNNETIPAPPPQLPNGLVCYTCDPIGCSKKLTCVGDQNLCITSTVQQGGSAVFMKGCASKSICDAAKPNSQGIAMVNVSCCQGNLCNGAESFTLRFLLMLVPLTFSILIC